MSDLISRKLAVEGEKTSFGRQKVAIEALRKLPSVEPETCGDCISREAAIDRFDLVQSDDLCMSYDDIMAFLSSLPSVEPERNKGKWIENKWGEETCSECEYTHKAEGSNFCPNCGAKMEVN